MITLVLKKIKKIESLLKRNAGQEIFIPWLWCP